MPVVVALVLVGVALKLTVVFYPAEGDAVRGHFHPFVAVHLGVVPSRHIRWFPNLTKIQPDAAFAASGWIEIGLN
jgi:hypothetical protein